MWDLPRPGLEPVSPALAGRFLTTVPPGKPLAILYVSLCLFFVGPVFVLFLNPFRPLPTFTHSTVFSEALLLACSGHTVSKAESLPSCSLYSSGTDRTINILSSEDDKINKARG